MQEIIDKIQNDSTMMLIVGVGAAVFLVIFLVLIVSAMRIKVYKDNYRRIHAENKAISEIRSRLEQELKVYKITDQKNKKELAQERAEIVRLKADTQGYAALQKSSKKIEKELYQTQEELEASYAKYQALQERQETLQAQHDKLVVDNTKNRANNTRLLRKIEQNKG